MHTALDETQLHDSSGTGMVPSFASDVVECSSKPAAASVGGRCSQTAISGTHPLPGGTTGLHASVVLLLTVVHQVGLQHIRIC